MNSITSHSEILNYIVQPTAAGRMSSGRFALYQRRAHSANQASAKDPREPLRERVGKSRTLGRVPMGAWSSPTYPHSWLL